MGGARGPWQAAPARFLRDAGWRAPVDVSQRVSRETLDVGRSDCGGRRKRLWTSRSSASTSSTANASSMSSPDLRAMAAYTTDPRYSPAPLDSDAGSRVNALVSGLCGRPAPSGLILHREAPPCT
jgi:hypothetical protein